MLTVEDFIAAGYKEFNTNNINNSDFGLQKLISDEIGKNYFINVWVYDWSKYQQFKYPHRFTFSPDVQLKFKNDMRFDVKMLLDQDNNIQDIESFYSEMWEKMNCDYYERWE